MKIAILHEMLIKFGGAEKVVEMFLEIFPNADIFTLIYDEKKIGDFFQKSRIHPQVFSLSSQKIYNIFRKQRLCLPFMSKSVEQLDFSEYDIVLCSSSGFAHGAITKPETKYIVYYHSPARYLWDWTNEYKKDIGFQKGIKGYFLNKLFLKLRQWDVIASERADISVANSLNTQKRITKYYRKESQIIYPGVDTKRFAKKTSFPSPNLPNPSQPPLVRGGAKQSEESKGYYIIISALTEFKKIEVAIEAFNKMLGKKLLIIGQGNYKETLEKTIKNKNIELVGPKYGEDLVSLVQNSLGLIFPGEEDFGIVPIEVMAAGKPVFAYKGGGLTETVIEGKTGAFFVDKDGQDFVDKFQEFDTKNLKGFYKKEACQKQAKNFDKEHFKKQIKQLCNRS